MAVERAHWGSRFGFILAAAGSAIGLGNIWKFPYITGENGGGLFVLIYLVCIGIVGIPIMMAEIMIGRAAQAQPVVAFERLQGRKTGWAAVGWMGIITGFIILSYYIVVAGWAMDYTLKSVVNITEPIHDNAESAATNYRVTASLDDMRHALILHRTDQVSRDAARLIQRRVRPSAREDYALYQAGLAEAGVQDLAVVNAVKSAWGDASQETQAAAGVSDVVALDVTDEMKQSYERVRAILLEKPGFAERIPEAEGVLDDLQELRKETFLESQAYFAPIDAKTIRDDAEDLFRRNAISERVAEKFGAVATDGWTSSFWSVAFMLITILIVAGGVSSGIERTCKILMPTLFALILVMVFYGMFQRGFGRAFTFIFSPDPSKLQASGILEALGHAFFTLSLGMGAMITYGSYQRSKEGLASQSVTIAGLDTAVALLACLMMFPIIFSYDQQADAGPGLVFMSMPLAFAEIGKGGMLLAILFFGLLVFAALTSAISLLEVVASYFIDQLGWSRRRAVWSLGGIILLFGLASAFASDPDFLFASWQPSFGQDFFTTIDYLASNWMLPLGGMLIALYAGWVMPKRVRDAELEGLAPALCFGWLILVRFVAPLLVVVVLLQKVGILDADELFHGVFN